MLTITLLPSYLLKMMMLMMTIMMMMGECIHMINGYCDDDENDNHEMSITFN